MIHFDVAKKTQRIASLEELTQQDGFWDKADQAKRVFDEIGIIKSILSTYNDLANDVVELLDTYESIKQDYDEDLKVILDEEYDVFIKKLGVFEEQTLLSEEYDKNNAILELHPGAGGTESQDWAEMLYRMYSRYCERKGYSIEILDYLDGEEAGIKSVTMLVKGYNAYGYLKSEKGVHRLVRISPFDSNKRRHTSFASCDVIPEFNDEIEIDIKNEDLRVDTYRSSGAGGQHVNTTDSAIRITHIPSGIIVTCQNQRSQIKNRESAMSMLKSKLYQRHLEEQSIKMKEIQGEHMDNGWGSQIRSYVFHPYSLVKDNRTGYETGNTQAVMDGEIDGFIYTYLKHGVNKDGE